MIPYDELAAALERWRARNGLPVVSQPYARQGAPVTSYASPATATFMSAPPPAPAGGGFGGPRTAPPSAPPSRQTIHGVGAMPLTPPPTVDESVDDDLLEAEVVDDSQDGGFRQAASAEVPRRGRPTMTDEEDEHESSLMGPTPAPPNEGQWPEAPTTSGHQWGHGGDDDRDPADDDDLA